MKAERIELPGGYWIDTETVEQNIIAPDEEWVGSFNVGSDEQIDAFVVAMNADAARVQLLAKALTQARAELAREGCLQGVKAIDAALAEAGTESESK